MGAETQLYVDGGINIDLRMIRRTSSITIMLN